jgi:F420-non-reducing hydrogenase small subunit
MYWGSACGGCEVAVLNLGERLLLLDRFFEIVFFPCITDFKRSDLFSYDDGWIDLCFFNGAIRSSEDEEMAHVLRRKSRVLVSFGSCAHEGCVPALINLSTKTETFATVYSDCPSADPVTRGLPGGPVAVPEGALDLPTIGDAVRTLDQVEHVDFVVPGCPPEPHRIWPVIEELIPVLSGGTVVQSPSRVIGAERFALCEECPLERSERPVTAFLRPQEVLPEPGVCLLDQGLVCQGIATRAGCGALCPRVGMGCRGCYGTVDEHGDPGAAMVSALSTLVECGSVHDDEDELQGMVDDVMASVVDPVGTLYRFGLAGSYLRRARPPHHTGKPED